MINLFYKILQMNIYASIAILCVVLLRLLFKSMPKKFICLLWVVVAVRLVCPYTSESNFSVLNYKPVSNLVERYTGIKIVSEKSEVKEDYCEKSYNEKTNRNSVNEGGRSGSEELRYGVDRFLNKSNVSGVKIYYTYVWFAGILILSFVQIISNLKIKNHLKKIEKTVCDGYVESDQVNTPFAAGIIRPVIYIPSGMDDREKRYVLLHERIHVRNKDCVIKTFGVILLCINWFNPLIWLAYKLMCDDLEMRCDEEVVKTMNPDLVHEYCLSIILHSINTKAAYKVSGVYFAKKSFGGMEVKMRIKNMFLKKTSKTVAVMTLIASVAGVTVISTQAKADDKKVPASETVVSTENVEEVNTTADADKASNEVLEKYIKEYQDKGYVLPEDYNEGDTDVFLFDKLTDNNESINIKFSEEEFDSLDAFKASFKEIYGTVLKSEFSETDDCYVMSEKDDNLGYVMEYKYYKNDNVIVVYSTGLQNGVG